MKRLRIVLASVMLAAAAAPVAGAEPAAEFYRGKTLTVLIGSGAGGGLDQVSRAVVRHLGKHLSGHPTVVPKNLGGAGGLQALNNVHTTAPKDGTTIGVVLPALVFDPLFAGKKSGEGF